MYDQVGIRSLRYWSSAAVPRDRMAGRGLRNGFPPNWRCLDIHTEYIHTTHHSHLSEIGEYLNNNPKTSIITSDPISQKECSGLWISMEDGERCGGRIVYNYTLVNTN